MSFRYAGLSGNHCFKFELLAESGAICPFEDLCWIFFFEKERGGEGMKCFKVFQGPYTGAHGRYSTVTATVTSKLSQQIVSQPSKRLFITSLHSCWTFLHSCLWFYNKKKSWIVTHNYFHFQSMKLIPHTVCWYLDVSKRKRILNFRHFTFVNLSLWY